MKQLPLKNRRDIGLSAIFLIYLITISLFSIGINIVGNEKELNRETDLENEKYLKKPKSSTNIFGRIHIIGTNWTLTNNTYEWCNGSGTEMEPFVIEDLVIDAQGADCGILIENSFGIYFRIENCSVFGSSIVAESSAGIKFSNTANGRIQNCSIYNNGNGLLIQSSSENNIISGVNISNNTYNGINITSSSNNVIEYCKIYNNSRNGIAVYNSISFGNVINNSKIYNNSLESRFYQNIRLDYSQGNSVVNNTILDSHGVGIYGTHCNTTIFKDNYINNSEECGIQLKITKDIILINNTVTHNGNNTVDLYNLQNLLIENSTIQWEKNNPGSYAAIRIDAVSNGTIRNSTITGVHNGPVIVSSTDVHLSNLTITEISNLAVYFASNTNFSSINNTYYETSFYGICCDSVHNITIANCTGIGTKLTMNRAIEANFCEDLEILGNNLTNFESAFYSQTYTSNITFMYNYFADNEDAIIGQNHLDGCIIRYNTFSQNEHAVRLVASLYNVIHNNTIGECISWGVELATGSTGNNVTYNTFRLNSIGAISEYETGTNIIEPNDIIEVEAVANVNYTTIILGQIVHFDATASVGDPDLSFLWNFNDTQTSDQTIVNHYFNNPGTYNVTLTVTDGLFESDEELIVIIVEPDTNPLATITSNCSTYYNYRYVNFSFTYVSGNLPYQSYNWSIDGVQMGSNENFIYELTEIGTFTLILTVTDADGDTSQDITYPNVLINYLPTASFSTDAITNRALINQNILFTDESIAGDASDPINSYEWDFGDETTHVFLQNPDHMYPEVGIFKVILNVTDSNGDSDFASLDLIIELDLDPNAEFEVSVSPYYVGDIISFFCIISMGGNLPLSHQWDFSDGSGNSTIQDVTHTYTEAGVYPVIHTIIDRDGDIGVFLIEITVEEKYSADDENPWKNAANVSSYRPLICGLV